MLNKFRAWSFKEVVLLPANSGSSLSLNQQSAVLKKCSGFCADRPWASNRRMFVLLAFRTLASVWTHLRTALRKRILLFFCFVQCPMKSETKNSFEFENFFLKFWILSTSKVVLKPKISDRSVHKSSRLLMQQWTNWWMLPAGGFAEVLLCSSHFNVFFEPFLHPQPYITFVLQLQR